MQNQENIIDCYNKTARNYAHQYLHELDEKHLDRILLQSFAKENVSKGKLIDLGCGPGQTTKYLVDCGVTNITGADISPSMIDVAKSNNPDIHFETADILKLKYSNAAFGSAVAFYAIVHFDYGQLQTAFEEIKRVLAGGGEFLFSFHVGDNIVHLDSLLDHEVNIDFHFFETDKVLSLLTEAGFAIVDAIERQPYKHVEYPSKRAYIWAKKPA